MLTKANRGTGHTTRYRCNITTLSSFAPQIAEVPVTNLFCGSWKQSNLLLGRTASRTNALLSYEQDRRLLTNWDNNSKLGLRFKQVLLRLCNIRPEYKWMYYRHNMTWKQPVNWLTEMESLASNRCTNADRNGLTKLIAEANFIISLPVTGSKNN